jgi:preprotein translocase subunit SecE
MKNLITNSLKVKETLLYFFILAISIICFLISYLYSFTMPIQFMIGVIWLVAASVLFYFTELGQWVLSFSKEAKTELNKVIWPSRQETVQVTMLVMVMVTVASFVLWTCDSLMLWTVAKITHLG